MTTWTRVDLLRRAQWKDMHDTSAARMMIKSRVGLSTLPEQIIVS